MIGRLFYVALILEDEPYIDILVEPNNKIYFSK